jgi:hypothetical protein
MRAEHAALEVLSQIKSESLFGLHRFNTPADKYLKSKFSVMSYNYVMTELQQPRPILQREPDARARGAR